MMVKLYLDLETYRSEKEGAFVEERRILSELFVNETPYQEDYACQESTGHIYIPARECQI